MIPIRDSHKVFIVPWVTYGLVGINALVFVVGLMQPDGGERMTWKYGFLPAALTHGDSEVREAIIQQALRTPSQIVRDRMGYLHVKQPRSYANTATQLPAWVKLFTCMFMHGGWMHLIGNMMYLYIFGNNIEERLGHGLYIVFYLVTGVIGTLAHTLVDPSGLTPLVGASGAISGVLGAYILLFPHAEVEAFLPIGFYFTTVTLPAWAFLGFYAVMQLLNGLPALTRVAGGGVAYWAHIGGFAAGMALIKLLPRRPFPPGGAARGFPLEPESDDEISLFGR